MKERVKKIVGSPLFLPILAAPVLFGIGFLLLSLREGYEGPWYYALYILQHFLSAAFYFYGLHRVFRAIPTRGMPRALTGAIPILVSLSVYHFAIAFFDNYAVMFYEASTSFLYAFLSLLTDSIAAEWLLLFFTAFFAYLFFLRRGSDATYKRAAGVLSALLYLAFLAVGEIAEYLSYVSSHFGFADEKTTRSFLLILGFDLLLSAAGFLLLRLFDKTKKEEVPAK